MKFKDKRIKESHEGLSCLIIASVITSEISRKVKEQTGMDFDPLAAR